MSNFSKILPGVSWGNSWKRSRQTRILVLGLCFLVGCLAGAAASLMHLLAEVLHGRCGELLSQCGDRAFWLAPALPTLGILFCVVLGRIFWRRHPMETNLWTAIREARHPGHGMRPYHAFSHILTSGTAVGLGISAGMEAPSALTGAAIGDNLGRKLGLPRETRTLLLCAGAGGAIGGVFNAPLAGALFTCEILLPGTSAVTLIPLLCAAAGGAIVSQLCGVNVRFPEIAYSWRMENLWLYLLAGLVCGLLSAVIIRLNCRMLRLRQWLGNPWIMALGGAVALYLILLALPMLGGSGLEYVLAMMRSGQGALHDGLLPISQATGWALLGSIALCVFLKPLASVISIQSGGDGGMFAPSLVTGAYMGFFFHYLLGMAHFTGFPLINCMAAGMAGILAGVMQAPLTGLFLIAELLGGYQLFVPLMLVVAISSFICRCLSKGNIYFAAAAAVQKSGKFPQINETMDDYQDTPVGELADRSLYTLSPHDSFRTLLNILMHSPQELFPVLDRQGRLVGVIQEKNLRPFLLERKLYDILVVDDFMALPPPDLPAEAPLAQATRIFDTTNAEFIPVTKDGRFLGVLTRAHLLESHRSLLTRTDLF